MVQPDETVHAAEAWQVMLDAVPVYPVAQVTVREDPYVEAPEATV